MYERVQIIDPWHQVGESHEEALDWQFPEDVNLLLNFDQLQRVPSCNVYCAFNQCDSGESATQLIDLFLTSVAHLRYGEDCAYPVDKCPVPGLN